MIWLIVLIVIVIIVAIAWSHIAARKRREAMLEEYAAPAMDPDVRGALDVFVERRIQALL